MSETTGTASRAGLQLLEREGEVACIRAALDGARAGRGALVVLEGPAGIGKTSLLAVARDEARAGGLRVLTARGSELELEFGHGVVRQLFEPSLLGAPPERRDELLAGAAGLAAPLFGLRPGGEAVPGLGVDPTFALMHGLYWLCANLAARAPVLLAVDDAHWADPPSLRFLAFLARRLEDLPVVLVCAFRAAEPTAAAPFVAELVGDPQAQLLHPVPLTATGVAALVRAGLEAEPDQPFVAACLAATGGIPFLVRELLLALRADDTLPIAAYERRVSELGPQAIARSVLLRLGRLDPACGAFAQALAVLGADAELRHVAALAGLGMEEAGRAADVLAAAGILERTRPVQFVHPVVRTAIHADLPASQRELRHASAARLFAAEGAPLDRVAAHLLAAAPAGDAWAVDRLRAAAQAAMAQGAPESAAHYLARALDEPAPPEQRPQLLLDLGGSEVHAGRAAGGARHLEEALSITDDPAIVRSAGLMLGRAQALQEQPRDAITTFDRLLARLDPPDRDERLMLESAIAAQAQIHSVPASLVAPRLESLRRAAEQGPVPRAAAAVLAVDAIFRAAPASEAAALARRSLEGTPRPFPQPGDPHLLFHACMALVWAEHEAEARRYYDAALEDARDSGSAPRLAAAACGRGLVAFRAGTVAETEADARLALDVCGDAGNQGFYPPFALALLLGSLVERGALDEAERELEAFGPITGARSSYSITLLLLARARLHRIAGRFERALADAREAGARLARMEARAPAIASWRSETSLALLGLGNRAEAAEIVAEEVALARAAETPRATGMALVTSGLVHGDVGLLREAVAVLEPTSAELDRARARTALGAALRRSGLRAEARDHLRVALDLAHRAGSASLAAQARDELVAAGARPRTDALSGLDALTPSERRVAQMAAGGLTNREIAQALFVTPRTVEGHLTNVYAKLGVATREDLGGVVEGTVPPAIA